MGSRRTHEWSAVAAARAAYIAGFATTSNLQAGRRLRRADGRHRGALVHAAARHRARRLRRPGRSRSARARPCSSTPTTSREAVQTAVERGRDRARRGPARLRRPRLCWRKQVRRQLDDLGATKTRIIVTSDLDEYAIAGLAAAPVDGYGVGTSLVTGSGHPTCGFVYKLVARADSTDDGAPMRAVAKKSTDKISIGGRKWALRRRDAAGTAEAEVDRDRRAPRRRR